MNYYNPYFSYPYMSTVSSATNGGLFSKLLGKGINWGSILSGTQKTLNIVNQAIPLVKQVSPVMKNAKTMFKIMNEFKKVDTPNDVLQQDNFTVNDTISTEDVTSNSISSNNGPTFFI